MINSTDMIEQTFKWYTIYMIEVLIIADLLFLKLLFITMIIFNKAIHRKKVRLFMINIIYNTIDNSINL